MLQRLSRPLVVIALLAAGASCQRQQGSGPAPSATVSPSASAPAHAPKTPPKAQERVDIPGGVLRSGSTPGDPGRIPELEPKDVEVELGPFAIDRLPYPNDPNVPALLGVPRDEARRLCAERGARLCTELEWERACKGPKQDPYPSGVMWDPSCTAGAKSCASGFDVLGLGTTAGEWVAGDLVSKDERQALVRGAGKGAAATAHRCAARHPTEASSKSEEIGFRCCHGAPNAAAIAPPTQGPVFAKTKLTAQELEAMLATDPAAKALAKDIKFFREPDSANTVVSRGPGDKKGFDFTVSPLLWSPAPGVELLLVAARSGERTSFVAAFHVLPGGKYRVASTFTLQGEPGPVALAFTPDIRPRVHFSTCWGCPGETGKALFRRPETVVIVQP